MKGEDLQATARAAVILLLRSYGLFLCWCVLGAITAFRFLLLPIGGGLLILSTLGALFWFAVGIATLSIHCVLLALSCGIVGLVGMLCCGLATGTFLAQLCEAVDAARRAPPAIGMPALNSPRSRA